MNRNAPRTPARNHGRLWWGDEGFEHIPETVGRLCQMLRTRLLWPDQHRADSCQPHQSAAEQESGDLIGEEPRPQHLPESAAHRGTTGKERRHRATHIGRHSVGQGRNDRRDHHVQANHAYAVADADQPYIVKETDQCKRYAADNAARNDPGVRRPNLERVW